MSPEEEDDFVALTRDFIEAKIIHTLTIYPKLSPSMLQVGIGTGVPPTLWRPVFRDLILQGRVIENTIQTEVPNGRIQAHKIIELVKNNAN